MQPDSKRFISLLDTPIYGAGSMGRRWISPPLQKAGAWRFQLAAYERRSTGDHAGTIPGTDARVGDCLQTSDPGSASTGSSVKHCAKQRKQKIFLPLQSRTNRQLSTTKPYYIHSMLKYLPAAGCCVDKYSGKPKKLLVFWAF